MTIERLSDPTHYSEGGRRDAISGLGGWFWGTAALLSLVFFPALAWGIDGTGSLAEVALALTTVTYAGAKLSGLIRRGEPRIVSATFWLFIYTSSGLASLAQTFTGLRPYLRDADTYVVAQVLIVVVVASFELGSVMSRSGSRRPGSLLRPTDGYGKVMSGLGDRILRPSRLWIATGGSMLSAGLYVAVIGDPMALFQSRRDLANSLVAAGLRDGSQVQSAILLALGQVPAIVVLAVWIAVYRRCPEMRTGSTRLAIFLLAMVNLVVNNPISNSRYWFTAVLLGLVYSIFKLRPTLLRSIIIGGLLFAVLLFPYSDYFRNSVDARSLAVNSSIAVTMSTKDFDQTIMTANGIWYEAEYGHTDGRQLLGVGLFFVPRSVWADKPLDTGVLLGQQLSDAGTTNLSSPLWIEIWLDFGWPGVILAFALVGVLVARLDEMFVMHGLLNSTTIRLSSYLTPFLAGYTFILLRGPLLQSMSRLSVLLVIAFLITSRAPEFQSPTRSDEGAVAR